jgi:hypothetical protein
MSSSRFIFTSIPCAKEDILLASVIPNKRYPNQDVLTPIKVKEGNDFTVNIDSNFREPVSLYRQVSSPQRLFKWSAWSGWLSNVDLISASRIYQSLNLQSPVIVLIE